MSMEVDYIGIEREYRAAQMAIPDICAHFGIDRAKLNHLVTKYGWTRNLRKEVLSATEEAVLRRTAGPTTSDDHQTFVEKAGERTADVIMSHRKDIAELRSIASKFRDRLVKLIGDDDCDEDVKVHPLDIKLLGRSQGSLDGLVRLTDAYSRIIQMERQAIGLDDPNAPVDADSLRATVEAARQELIRRGTFVQNIGRGPAIPGGSGGQTSSVDRNTTTH